MFDGHNVYEGCEAEERRQQPLRRSGKTQSQMASLSLGHWWWLCQAAGETIPQPHHLFRRSASSPTFSFAIVRPSPFMALEVSAAIIGILAAAGKVAETLGPLVSAYVNAPKYAQTILTKINHTRIALLGLQSLFEKFGTISQRRKELLPVDQLVVALTDGVLLFSQLEASFDRLKDPKAAFSNRFRWAKKEHDLDRCVTRLLGFKTSLALMLGILQWWARSLHLHWGLTESRQ